MTEECPTAPPPAARHGGGLSRFDPRRAVRGSPSAVLCHLRTPVVLFCGAALLAHFVAAVRLGSGEPATTLVSLALLLILLNGGRELDAKLVRRVVWPIGLQSVVGTLVTVGILSLVAHGLLGLPLYLAVLLAAALAPTDPAMVFSVLGEGVLATPCGVMLAGESGFNDPVGIALVASLLGAGALTGAAVDRAGVTFLLQMAIGGGIGVVGGLLLAALGRVVSRAELSGIGIVLGALGLFEIAAVLGGSGFLAVFVAGMIEGNSGHRSAHGRAEIQLAGQLASLGEVVVFVVLGLTVRLGDLGRADVVVPGLVLGALLAFVVRPIVVGLLLGPFRFRLAEQLFVMLAGLRGAVPLYLGLLLLGAHIAAAGRLDGIAIVVVVFSMVGQAGFVAPGARRLGLTE